MLDLGDFRIIDIGIFVMANLINLLLIGIFLSRPKGLQKLEHILGLFVVAMILPVGLAIILNILGKREWWAIVLPAILILFLAVELLFDYILKLNFVFSRYTLDQYQVSFIICRNHAGSLYNHDRKLCCQSKP